MKTSKAKLVTGAVLPAFNHPLKVAGELGMLDAITGGRLEVGFGRAFLPHEFAHFRVSLDESRARFEEGMEQVRLLLEEENVTAQGQFHSFENVTSLPRPTQKPRPPFWVASVATPESFTKAGRAGYGMMAIPLGGGQMADLLGHYREAWKSAGHPGQGQVMLAFHMFCHQDSVRANEISHDPLNRYLRTLGEAASGWLEGTTSKDYPGYRRMIESLAEETFETQVAKGAAWIGNPQELIEQIKDYDKAVGGFDSASMQVNFNTISLEDAEDSMRLFSAEVMPHLRS
jgi:alkanesulfonate monooxygenase SsuD/methylene tetrahydromethanopterin reductase-like flavin-dependent oxidoreductase (luciferase family)